jgi:hypothetical protein
VDSRLERRLQSRDWHHALISSQLQPRAFG